MSRQNLESKVAQSLDIIDRAVKEHNPGHLFGMFSGGHDSLCATHLASRHPIFTAAAHINTTIGIEETRQFARDFAAKSGWPFREYFPPQSYEEIISAHGFPGPGGHRYMYSRLKERCVRALVREHKKRVKDRVALVTGVRLSESVRRMGNVSECQRNGAQVWVAPILHWNDDDKIEYMAVNALPRNPVVDRLCMPGECLCGAFAKKEEFIEISLHYPAAAAEITRLEGIAAANGKHAKWGTRPPGVSKQPTSGGIMCSSCNAKNLV